MPGSPMHRVAVFGEPALAQFILLRTYGVVPVALCARTEALSEPFPLVLFADRGMDRTPERAAALAALARSVRAGRTALAFRSEREAARWVESLEQRGLPEHSSLRRILVYGESGAGKTMLAGKLRPALGLPEVSLDHELWWRDGREKDLRARLGQVERLAEDEDWLVEGVYRSVALPFARRAQMTIHLDLPSSVARRQRESRGPADGNSTSQRLLVASLRRSYPLVGAPLIRRDLSRLAHRGLVLRIHTEEERDEVTEALVGAVRQATGPRADASSPSA